MKISSIVDIVNGKLQNTPSISFITQQHTDILKVNDGDLFISSSIDDIKNAINKGAFAIIYDIEINIDNLNSEIAFIKVSSINNALTKLSRYNLINKTIISYLMDDVCINILQSILLHKQNIIILNDDIKYNFELLKNTNNGTIILSSNKIFLFDIDPKSKVFQLDSFKLNNLIVHSLFETTFSYKHKYFYKLKLSYLYINKFINIINFLENNNIRYDINKVNTIKYMQAIFINKNNSIVEFGKSNQFILANNIETTVHNELNFIKEHYKYGTTSIIDGDCSDDELFEKIKASKCNAIYIINKTQTDIINILNKNTTTFAKLF